MENLYHLPNSLDREDITAEQAIDIGFKFHQNRSLMVAMNAYRRALELPASNKTRAIAMFNIGVCWEDMGRQDFAVNAYKEALKVDPDYEDAKNNLGLLEP